MDTANAASQVGGKIRSNTQACLTSVIASCCLSHLIPDQWLVRGDKEVSSDLPVWSAGDGGGPEWILSSVGMCSVIDGMRGGAWRHQWRVCATLVLHQRSPLPGDVLNSFITPGTLSFLKLCECCHHHSIWRQENPRARTQSVWGRDGRCCISARRPEFESVGMSVHVGRFWAGLQLLPYNHLCLLWGHCHPPSDLGSLGGIDILIGWTRMASSSAQPDHEDRTLFFFVSSLIIASTWPPNRCLINSSGWTWLLLSYFGGHNVWRFFLIILRWVRHTWALEVKQDRCHHVKTQETIAMTQTWFHELEKGR